MRFVWKTPITLFVYHESRLTKLYELRFRKNLVSTFTLPTITISR